MRISTKTYYGIRAMANLAQKTEVSPIADIAYEERIPSAFLEKIMQQLHRHKLVQSQMGTMGGYSLVKNPEKISIKEIFLALGETIEASPCYAENCPHHTGCKTIGFWQKLESSLYDTLSSITLEDLIK